MDKRLKFFDSSPQGKKKSKWPMVDGKMPSITSH